MALVERGHVLIAYELSTLRLRVPFLDRFPFDEQVLSHLRCSAIRRTTIIAAQAGGIPHALALIVCIGVMCVLLWALLRAAHVVGARLSTTALNVATRILGLILAAIAIETMADGLKVLFPAFA